MTGTDGADQNSANNDNDLTEADEVTAALTGDLSEADEVTVAPTGDLSEADEVTVAPTGDLSEADEVTVAANSDLLAQIRDEAQELKRERTGDHDDQADQVSDEVTVWRPAVEVRTNVEGFEAESDATAVMDTSTRGDLVGDPGDTKAGAARFDNEADATAVLDNNARAALTDQARTPPTHQAERAVPTTVLKPEIDVDASLIGDEAPPPTAATYWQTADEPDKRRSASQAKQRRRAVPIWLLVLVAVIVIVGASVAIALLVASGAS